MLHESGASEYPIRCPCVIWRYQDLFLMPMGASLARNKLGDIVINAVGGSGDGRRSCRARSGLGWTGIVA